MSTVTDTAIHRHRVARRSPAPRWRGFNLPCSFTMRNTCVPEEQDFVRLADRSFDFIRLPLCYTLWTDDAGQVNQGTLARVDRAVQLGRQHGLHVQLSLYRNT